MKLFLRIFLLLFFIGLLPLIMVGTFYFSTIESAIVDTTVTGIENLGSQIGKEVRRAVRDAYINIRLLAENPILDTDSYSDEDIQAELEKTWEYYQIFKDITIIDTAGNTIASVSNSFRGAWQSTSWYKSALRGESLLSDVHAVLYPFEVVMTAAAPVVDDSGTVASVLVGQIDMEKVWSITQSASTGAGSEVYLVNKKGIVIDSPNQEIILEPFKYRELYELARQGVDGVVRLSDDEIPKTAVQIAFGPDSSDPALDWSLAVIQPDNIMYAQIYKVRFIFLLASFFTVVGILYVSSRLGYRFSKKVNKLLTATNELGKENFSFRLEDMGKDEFGIVGRSINLAVDELAFSRESRAAAERELLKANENLAVSQQRYELAARGAHDAIWDWDILNNTIYLSSRWWEITGEENDGEIHDPSVWISRIHPDDQETVQSLLEQHLEQKTSLFDVEYRVRHSQGDFRWINTRGDAIWENHRVIRMAGSHTDITSRKQLQEKISFFAYYDELTELPNRTLFLERLDQALQRARRVEGYSFSILFLDYDRFKHVNDTYGHATGDLLLISIAQRLKHCVRPLDVVSRMGGMSS